MKTVKKSPKKTTKKAVKKKVPVSKQMDEAQKVIKELMKLVKNYNEMEVLYLQEIKILKETFAKNIKHSREIEDSLREAVNDLYLKEKEKNLEYMNDCVNYNTFITNMRSFPWHEKLAIKSHIDKFIKYGLITSK